jgi:hypothetical protein
MPWTNESVMTSIGLGFFLMFSFVLSGFLIALRGGSYLNEKRIGLGSALTGVGFCCIIGGYLLWLGWPI